MLVTGASGAAPVRTPKAAQLALQQAITEEERALALLSKSPPRRGSALQLVNASYERLYGVYEYLQGAPGAHAAEVTVRDALTEESYARLGLQLSPSDAPADREREKLRLALALKRDALPLVRRLRAASAGVPECSDGKDNDRDGAADAAADPGCGSPKDARERSPFTCDLAPSVGGGRFIVRGACTGPFAEFDVTLLDSQLNGRYDVEHAPRCGAPTPTGFRCTAKDGLQNPQHLVVLRLTTTSLDRKQRVRLRFFDRKKRRIAVVQLPALR